MIEEIADVKNVAPQVEYLLGIEDDVEPMMEYKLDRTIKEVEEQQKKMDYRERMLPTVLGGKCDRQRSNRKL